MMMPRFSIAIASFLAAGIASAQSNPLADLSAEWLQSDDIRIQSGWTAVDAPVSESLRLRGRVDILYHDLDYQPNAPIDPLGNRMNVEELQSGLQLDLESTRNRHRFTVSGFAYEGFRNHASIWIDRYYRQQYAGGGIPGAVYRVPDPSGYGAEAAYRLEVVPSAGFLTLSAGFVRDTVAPGYEIEDQGNAFALVRGTNVLETWTGSLEWEGVLNSRSRTQFGIRATETTERDLRLAASAAMNFLVSDKWIARLDASFAHEDPDFEAWSVTHAIEYAMSDRWSLAASFRSYSDTGQIEAANLVSSAAPDLHTRLLFLSLRYSSLDQTSSFSIGIGPYRTDYGETAIGTERFRNLYRDRDWFIVRIAGRLSF